MKNFKALLCTLLFLGCTAFITVSLGATVQKGDYPSNELLTPGANVQPEIAVLDLISYAPQVELVPVMSLVFDPICEGYPSQLVKPPTNVFVLLRIYRPPSRHWC